MQHNLRATACDGSDFDLGRGHGHNDGGGGFHALRGKRHPLGVVAGRSGDYAAL